MEYSCWTFTIDQGRLTAGMEKPAGKSDDIVCAAIKMVRTLFKTTGRHGTVSTGTLPAGKKTKQTENRPLLTCLNYVIFMWP